MAVLDEPPAKNDPYMVNVALSLLSCFDFSGSGEISRTDWRRGTKLLALGDVSRDDRLWNQVLRTYGAHMEAGKPRGSAGVVHVEDINDAPPMAADPLLISHVVKSLIQRIGDLTEKVDKLVSFQARHDGVRIGRAVLSARQRTARPVMEAWHEAAQQQRALRRKAAQRALQPGLARSWRAWAAQAARRAVARRLVILVARFSQWQRSQRLVSAVRLWRGWRGEAVRRAATRRLRERRAARFSLSSGFGHWLCRARSKRPAPAEPPVKVKVASVEVSIDRPRAPLTGWHTDLSVHGTNALHRDEVIAKAESQTRLEQLRGEALNSQLLMAEARAAVLERRVDLSTRVGSATAPYVIIKPSGGVGGERSAADAAEAARMAAQLGPSLLRRTCDGPAPPDSGRGVPLAPEPEAASTPAPWVRKPTEAAPHRKAPSAPPAPAPSPQRGGCLADAVALIATMANDYAAITGIEPGAAPTAQAEASAPPRPATAPAASSSSAAAAGAGDGRASPRQPRPPSDTASSHRAAPRAPPAFKLRPRAGTTLTRDPDPSLGARPATATAATQAVGGKPPLGRADGPTLKGGPTGPKVRVQTSGLRGLLFDQVGLTDTVPSSSQGAKPAPPGGHLQARRAAAAAAAAGESTPGVAASGWKAWK